MSYRRRRSHVIAVAIGLLLACIARGGPAWAAETEFVLTVRGTEGRASRMTVNDLRKLKRTSVRAKDEKGIESVWEGAALHDVLKAAGFELGATLRGKALANFLLVEARDGYRAVFALPELDPGFSDLVFLLAHQRDRRPMSEHEGVLRIIVPHEKRHARWVRQVVSISVRSP
jgi:DMSO/TMAO reductase YedYZ molybdopterin-dependent catalytic subunit